MRIPHVCTSVQRAAVLEAPLPPTDTLDLECSVRGLRHSLWIALYFAQKLRRADFDHRLTALVRDLDRELA